MGSVFKKHSFSSWREDGIKIGSRLSVSWVEYNRGVSIFPKF